MSDQSDSSTPITDRVVRVFISSTFKDMHEREELVKFTFERNTRRPSRPKKAIPCQVGICKRCGVC